MCVNQINQSIVGHNNIYYEHDDDGMVWYGIWHRYDLYYSIIIIVWGKLNGIELIESKINPLFHIRLTFVLKPKTQMKNTKKTFITLDYTNY